ncbi:hypothetical protein BGX38DRAFT_1101965 [Terfezia claveryi]|nr:hypothetical protein BGX38DRAFT_1101965 [Terfezia claveryi]
MPTPTPTTTTISMDDDAAEAASHPHTTKPIDGRDRPGNVRGKKKKERGQNKGRKFQFSHDAIQLCPHLSQSPSTDKPLPCQRIGAGGITAEETGERENGKGGGVNGCTFEHDIRKYLKKGKKTDLDGVCPVWAVRGECPTAGWRCRWLNSHLRTLDNGEMELVVDEDRRIAFLQSLSSTGKGEEAKVVEYGTPEILNEVHMKHKIVLRKNKFEYPISTPYLSYIETQKEEIPPVTADASAENLATYVEARFPIHEKRPLFISPDKPILAPLTTTGNLPFRRLCTQLGAGITYSEMAMSLPLLQGQKSEWALLRAHASEVPNFGAQICAMKPWQAVKVTEAITKLIPSRSMNLIDLNCGCPIDMVYRSGGGSALLDQHGKLFKMLKGMAYVSGETPITCKIRMGTKDANPSAKKLLQKLWSAGDVSAVTLHGRSRQQRYTREADWGYIAECAALIEGLKKEGNMEVDTAGWKEGHDLPQATVMHFIGNGDVYSHHDYYAHLTAAPALSSVMVARGALIKPWIFEEIEKKQYLDKSGSERLEYVRDFVRMGLETWGADEFGVGTTRRFLLEWLSFTCRYVPVGVLECLPPKIQDRPPVWKGRDDREGMLASGDCKDWLKISEMFLGKAPDGFVFVPKHKSNAHGAEEGEAEG